MVACRLYRDALAPSSRTTYRTGVRHLHKFRQKYPMAPLPPAEFNPPSKISISLVFFAAHLFELDTIKSHGTIRNYMSHVTQFYIKKGIPKKKLVSPLLSAVMRGIKRCMPPKQDSRIAFLLIHYHIPRRLTNSRTVATKTALAAMSLGFFAMLRFHSYEKFFKGNLTLVLKGGREISPSQHSSKTVLALLVSNGVAGFYFTFNDKFHPRARAYFCQVGDLHRRLKRICPLKHLTTLYQCTQNGVFFPKTELTRDVLIKNMKDLTCIEKNVKPHSLRIGGHTYYTVYGLDPSFRDYLARRKVKESTQTYYRASPHLTIYKLRQFFKRTFT